MSQSIKHLLGWNTYLGALLPVLVYSCILAFRRQQAGQQWGILFILVAVNLGWYVVSSIGWPRYAFPGLAIASLFVARFFYDLTGGLELGLTSLWKALRNGQPSLRAHALRLAMLVWLGLMVAYPLQQIVRKVAFPPYNSPVAMAAYLDQYVPHTALIETWEPEMGFLTDHNYHFASTDVLNSAVRYVWHGGPPPATEYDFVQTKLPDYVLVGPFARWVDLYPAKMLALNYKQVVQIGDYELYAR